MSEKEMNQRMDLALQRIGALARCGKSLAVELGTGVWKNQIPWGLCSTAGIVTCTAFIKKWDYRAFEYLGVDWLYPSHPKLYPFYWFGLVTGSFWVWAVYRVGQKTRFSRRIHDQLLEIGLKSPRGKVPQLVYDIEIDEQTKKMALTPCGFSVKDFQAEQLRIETNLQIYIDEIKENKREGYIEVVYAEEPMPTRTVLPSISEIPFCKFIVGETRSRIVRGDIREIPHLLIAGQPGGGKSTFLRQFIITLYLNLPDSRFTFIDLKAGLESQIFENLKRVKTFDDVKKAVQRLSEFQRILETRMNLLKQANCKDLDQYAERLRKDKSTPKIDMGRYFIIVDEAAELFLTGADRSLGDIQNARRVLSQIARQGRAAGVHLIVATQRPDSKALDPQIKANLPGVLCFQMVNDTSSIAVLGNGRATDLPAIPGRAIWKVGAEMVEIQTPVMTTDEAEVLLKPHRTQPQKMPVVSSTPKGEQKILAVPPAENPNDSPSQGK